VALIRLRNLFVHRYWVIDDERVYWSVRNNFKCIPALLDFDKGFAWALSIGTSVLMTLGGVG
jgi:Uncharacterized conserved protein